MKPRVATVAILLAITGCGNAVNSSALVDKIKANLEQHPCDVRIAPLEHAGFYRSYEEDPIKCWGADFDSVALRTFYVSGPNGAYRTILLYPLNVPPSQIIVSASGGPRLTTIPYSESELRKSATFHLAQNGALVVVPDHLGTISRSFYPESDVEPAMIEIKDLIDRLRKITDTPVVGILAPSAGAIIGIDILRNMNENVVLLSPPIASFSQLILAPKGSDIPANAADHVRYFTTIDRQTGNLVPVHTSDRIQVSAYAGPAYTRSLKSQLDDIPKDRRRCLSVVYGTADRRIIVGGIGPLAARHPWLTIVKIPGYAHRSASEEEGAKVGKTILTQFDRLPCARKTPVSVNSR